MQIMRRKQLIIVLIYQQILLTSTTQDVLVPPRRIYLLTLELPFLSLVPPTCSLTVTQEQVGGVSSLSCEGDGIPLPEVTKWEKDSKPLPVDSDFQIKPGKTGHQERLDIYNFGMRHLGVYECFVSNELGSSSCAMNIRGKYMSRNNI